MRTLSSSTSSASTRPSMFFCNGRVGDIKESHFLDSCSLCSKPLYDSDIFMYRGNTPFCSKECRQEQIDIDEACERQKWKRSSSSKARSSVSRSDRKTGTVAVA